MERVRRTKKNSSISKKPRTAKVKLAGKDQHLVDQLLTKINPNLQKKVYSLARQTKGELSVLASKIFLRAQKIRKSLTP